MSIDEFVELASLPVHHLSPSSIAEFIACRERWRRKYVLGEWEKAGPPALVGWAFHKAVEESWTQRGGVEWWEMDPAGIWENAWSSALARDDFRLADTGADADALGERGAGLFGAWWADEFIRRPRPVAVEQWYRKAVPGVPPPLIARVDVAFEDGIVEAKTSGKALKEPQPGWHIQGLVQLYLTGLPIHWLVVTDSPAGLGPRVIRGEAFTLLPTRARLAAAELLVIQTWEAMEQELQEQGVPWLGAMSDICRWCSYRKRCAWWT